MRDVWKCCGCDAEVPNLIKTCDCVTMCAGLVGTGRHAWMTMPGDDDVPETWKNLAKHWEEIANALKRERDEARLALSAAPKAPIAEGWEDYDFIYDQDDWETTYDAGDASMLLVNLRENGDVHKFSTLRKGPPVFAAYVATLCDEDGEEFEGEWQLFPSKEAAQAAVAALPAPPTTGEQK